MKPPVQLGLLALIILSAAAAVYVSVIIARRQDLPAAARRAFLLSNVSLIFCLASAIAGFSIYLQMHFWGSFLLAIAAAFLILKFAFVRKFAHLIREYNPKTARTEVTHAVSKRT